MVKKRKLNGNAPRPLSSQSLKYDMEERFDNSEDDFYAGQDKILLDDDPGTQRRRRLAEQEKNLEMSDEEILGYDDEMTAGDEESNVHDSDGVSTPENGVDIGENGEFWGTERADYYNADVIETEADALEEEAEAKRLYQKQLKGMSAADFGFDESEWVAETATSKSRTVVEKLPEAQIPQDADIQQMETILSSRYPELHLLCDDFIKLQQRLDQLREQVARESVRAKDDLSYGPGIPVVVWENALTAYLSAVSMYFAVLSLRAKGSGGDERLITALPPIELHEHAVIESLSRTRLLWDRLQGMQMAELIPSATTDVVVTAPAVQSVVMNRPQTSTKKRKQLPLRDNDLVLGSDGAKLTPDGLSSQKLVKSSKPMVKLQTLIDQVQMDEQDSHDSEDGDEQHLNSSEAEEKARKRKSLRFYGSQIANKAAKRGNKSREAGGDDDLPHKERHRDRQARLLGEAEARGRSDATNLDQEMSEDENDSGRAMGGADEDYYDSLVTSSKRKTAEKAARAEAYAEATRQGASVYEEETIGADGKRAITYAIAKNKGLAPRRKKEVRNPRVKKKKKYEEKMKKLASMRPVYKGGESRGGYGGELTGIKSNLVKSVRLS